jgi:hypothetical protein
MPSDPTAQNQADGDPLVIHTAVKQSAGDGHDHADFASPNAMAGGRGGTHPLKGENEKSAGDEIKKFDEVLAGGEFVHDLPDGCVLLGVEFRLPTSLTDGCS